MRADAGASEAGDARGAFPGAAIKKVLELAPTGPADPDDETLTGRDLLAAWEEYWQAHALAALRSAPGQLSPEEMFEAVLAVLETGGTVDAMTEAEKAALIVTRLRSLAALQTDRGEDGGPVTP